MRAVLMLTLAIAPAVPSSESSSRPARLLDGAMLGFCPSRGLPTFRRLGGTKQQLCTSSAVVADAEPFSDFSTCRRQLRQSKALESRSRKRSEFGGDVSGQPIDVVLNGLRLGRGLRYQYPSSPRPVLWEKPALRGVLTKLHAATLGVIMEPECSRDLHFSSEQIAGVREELTKSYEVGEQHLTMLAQLFANHFTGGSYSCLSSVTAEAGQNSFTLTQTVPLAALREGADSLKLAAQQLTEMRVDVKDGSSEGLVWADSKMVDHSIEFEALKHHSWGVHRVIAHARSSQDYWKLISDSFFGIDHPDQVSQDHEQTSMYDIKIVVDDAEHAASLHRSLRNFHWNDSELREHGAPVAFATRRLELMESSEIHRTSTFNWMGTAITVHVQTLDEHYSETEMANLNRRKHLEAQREQLRQQLAQESPLFGFSRDLLQWIVQPSGASGTPPTYKNIRVQIHN